MGEIQKQPLRVSFDGRSKLVLHGSKITSDAGLLAYRELDEVLGRAVMTEDLRNDLRIWKNTQHSMIALVRQSIFSDWQAAKAPTTPSTSRSIPRCDI